MYVKNNISNISIQKVYFSSRGKVGQEESQVKPHFVTSNQSTRQLQGDHLDIIGWPWWSSFGHHSVTLEFHIWRQWMWTLYERIIFNQCMIIGSHLFGVKQCVYLYEWLITMGGCWKWWDCHRINYKSQGGFQFSISISTCAELELHRHNHLFFWVANKARRLVVLDHICMSLCPIYWYFKW